LAAKFILMIFAFSLIGVTPSPAPAQEQYPAVARLSFVSGGVTYSRGDDPDEWDDAIENVPLTIGDRIFAPEGGRAELQLSSGNFVRLAPRSYMSTLNLSDDIKQFYLGEGAASFNIRRLPSNEVFEVDTPNVSVTFDEPGRYRVVVEENGDSRIIVRGGRASVATNGRQIAVENSEIRVYGIDSPRYEIVGLPASDAFDRWVAERDDRYERSYSDAYRYASEDILGVEELSEYGRWEDIPDYGYAWTPTRVAAGWLPFSNGRWYWQDPWGWSWISNDRWGWATSHYGRWMPYRSRWYWVPVRPRNRVRYAPAVVEFVRVRDHVGWFPLHPRDRHVPWWERRDRRFDGNVTYVNRTYVTVVNNNTFITARPVNRYIVRDAVILRDARAARFTESLPIPNRSSIRIVAENGSRRGNRPSTTVINRTVVVRTALPNPPRRFQEKLPEIQKNQGRAVEPARVLAARDDDRAPNRVRVRPAADTGRGDFAARNPSANAGSELKPVTEARGKKLATRDTSGDNAADRTERAQKTPAAQPPQAEPSKGTASRSEPSRRETDRQQENQPADRARETRQEIEREKQAQQREEERKAQAQKQQDRERQQQLRERQAEEQKQREAERRQAQQKEEERKAQPQKQPAQEQRPERQSAQQRLEELERRQTLEEERKSAAQRRQEQQQREQQQAQDRQAQQEEQRKAQAQQQNRQEQERREQLKQQQQQERQSQQQRQQEQERRQQAQQQEQARREQQLRQQQQTQERQAREQQRQQQEVERRQQQQQREQERNAQIQRQQEQARAQQARQQQAQREAQQAQRQQEQERRPQPKQSQQQQERPVPQPQSQAPRQPSQF
jgi:hypothetical protein